ncbi:hypothetical protein [Schnuerera sp.]|uniref:hypothetical protein n=1 Tax=Schnuerera sp. TaxID=2794844 RepID=UPI002CB25CEC|nr:hypothetical protein [Schnuerera sp.]HSH36212.1 hypothetical protein [Schnuerera sp.]
MTREELLKVSKPILFSTEMVKAILEGRKSCTRRAIKLDLGLADTDKNDSSYLKIPDKDGDYHDAKDLCRYQPGDILYVRETWQTGYKGNVDENGDGLLEYLYRADGDDISVGYSNGKWKPSIHMPKKAARIFLKVTDIRVERLQDITSEQAKNEGVDLSSGTPFPKSTARDCHGAKNGLSMYQSRFVILWDSTMKKQDLDKYSWESNPFVWVIEFERVEVKNDRGGFNENKNKIL